jgi:hypothetical protein
VPVFDLLKTFHGEHHQALVVPWDGHPNGEAHRRLAEFLVTTILNEPQLAPRP